MTDKAPRPIDGVIAELDQFQAEMAAVQRQLVLLIVAIAMLTVLVGGLLIWRRRG